MVTEMLMRSMSEITQRGQTPVGPKDFVELVVKITTGGKHKGSGHAQRRAVGLTAEHTILSANVPIALAVFDTNNCPSRTLASANGRSLQSVVFEHNRL